MRRSFTVLALIALLAAAACSKAQSPASPSTTAQPASGSSNAVTGTWTGTAADANRFGANGTVMGMTKAAGMGPGMMGAAGGNMTWYITQTGETFTGTVAFSGVQCAAAMTMSGTFSGSGGTFTIDMPASAMTMAGCSGSATGKFTIDPATGAMRGTYSGTSTCMGAFTGELTLVRR